MNMMTEEAFLIGLALSVVAVGIATLVLFSRCVLRGQLRNRRWAVKLPVYFAAYHLGWFVFCLIGFPIFGKPILAANPVYALALHYGSFFERLLHVLPLPNVTFSTRLGGVIFLMFYVLMASTVLWLLVGVFVGMAIDFSGWDPWRRARTPGDA